MRHRNNRNPSKLLPNNPLHNLIRLAIHIARRLVQYEDLALPQHGSCETEELLLPLGERLRVHVGVQAPPVEKEVPQMDSGEGGDDEGVGDGARGIGVQAHAAAEDEGVLGDGDHAGADCFTRHRCEIHAVNGDGSALYVKEPEEREEKRTFAAGEMFRY